MYKMEKISTDYLLQTLEPDYKTVLVGDADMAPSELLEKNGAIYYYQNNETPGIDWLKEFPDILLTLSGSIPMPNFRACLQLLR